ncbi:MAG: tRNA uridine-5-carboxymethylaminomethyl(34) synthesis GTPase MnmE [Rickettsiales bacterium]|nr:tRNA uridine-5-carboxymethylaminomethyl(34) synthesis GTPase MnmE [Rickettsiales bacterium]
MQVEFPETIFALATPSGRSGVAIIRLSGSHARDALHALGMDNTPPAREARLQWLRHPQNLEAIDQALVLFFPAPHSFTGEDVAELHVHGSRAVISDLLSLLAELPSLRLAEPGEFARRAFHHQKLNLPEIEGLADLIEAETASQRRQALRMMQGELSNRCTELRLRLLHTQAYLEAFLDFPDEDLPANVMETMHSEMQQVLQKIEALLLNARQSESIREGYRIALLGVPNAGKSSLLNALAQRDAAIVTDIAGTTRDVLEIRLNIGGYLVILADTAGLRDTDDPIEQEGVKRALAFAQDADLRLWLLDPTQAASPQIGLLSDKHAHDIILVTKSDCAPVSQEIFQQAPYDCHISSTNPDQLDALIKMVSSRIMTNYMSLDDALLIRQRHNSALTEARQHIVIALNESDLTLKAESLRFAARQLAYVIGIVGAEDILDVVFSTFCLGK